MTNFVNLTPHTLKVKLGEAIIEIAPSGQVARVAVKEEVIGDIDGIPLVKRELGEAEGIPAPVEGTVYIVSAMVASATNRDDVVAPDTGSTAVRDEKGHIAYVTRFIAAG